ncbi:MAG: SMI1/KNR4 family protein [Tannerella sp.]|jgi:cell wall assembly regulator SMI1|nr:SMI1/KNR4 family protein [Tannerella sp.]
MGFISKIENVWYKQKGADPNQIAVVEQEFNIVFPDDYKEFLRWSNGEDECYALDYTINISNPKFAIVLLGDLDHKSKLYMQTSGWRRKMHGERRGNKKQSFRYRIKETSACKEQNKRLD